MKFFTLLLLSLFTFGAALAQESKKVTMKLTYKGAPLCYWDVTLKHGDVALKQGKTDDKGFVDFGYVQLLSYSVDASGYKKTANGEKTWDVKGYISLNEQGHADFDFQPLVEETGMGSMMEAAWGLTLNDCGSGSGGSSSIGSTTTNSGTTTTGSDESSTGTKSTLEQWEEESALKEAERQKQREQEQADWESGKTTAEGFQNQRNLYIHQLEDIDRKIAKKTEERNAVKPDSRDYSELSYEIQDLEIEKKLTQLKLEKTEKQIAKGNAPLDKTEREYYNQQEEKLKAERKALEEKQNSGVKISTEQPAESDTNSEVSEEEEFEKFVVYTAEEIASMSTLNLQKLKLEYSTKCGKRKTVLKAKGAIMKDDKKAQLEKEITELEKMIELMEAELLKRKDQ